MQLLLNVSVVSGSTSEDRLSQGVISLTVHVIVPHET